MDPLTAYALLWVWVATPQVHVVRTIDVPIILPCPQGPLVPCEPVATADVGCPEVKP